MTTAVAEETKLEISQQDRRDGKYLTFVLGCEEYGLEILKVREIIGTAEMKITSIPRVPRNIKGVINLRGKTIPIIDLRLKFGMKEREYGKETCIVVLNVKDGLIGIVVDTVSEVLDVDEKQIDNAPEFGKEVSTEFILGMGKVKDKVVILLDIDKVLSAGELTTINQLAKKGEVNHENIEE